MSEASAPSPETPENPPAETAPRARRVSKPRPKKAAKSAPKTKSVKSSESAEKPTPFPVFDEAPSAEPKSGPAPAAAESAPVPEKELVTPEAPMTGDDWPDSSSDPAGSSAPSEQPKRKRRRKKGKGNGSQNSSGPGPNEGEPSQQGGSNEDSDAASSQGGQQRRQNQAPRVRVDPELLAKFAWKIYLAEVSEEGVALVGDNDARELARRCFRLAELFLEEQGRRR